MKYFSLLTRNFTTQRQHSFVYNMTHPKLLTMGGWGILVLLDLSAAFHTKDHQKLLNLLNQSLGISYVAFKWLESYLKERTQTFQIGSCTSAHVTLNFGVPQGSPSGPTLYTMFTAPLGNIIRNMGWIFIVMRTILSCKCPSNQVHQYQIYNISIKIDSNILPWGLFQGYKDMDDQLNDDKTELIVITTQSNISKN